MSHFLQSTRLEDDAALFALALGPANRTSIALCGGSQRGFADISQLYGVWRELKLPVSLVTPPGLDRYLPVGVPHAVSSDRYEKKASVSAWQLVDSAGLVIVGPNMQLTSEEQVFYARLLPSLTVPVIVTDESLSLWNIDQAVRENPNISWLASARQVEKMNIAGVGKLNRERGVFGMEEFLCSIPVQSEFLMLYDALNLYSYVPASRQMIHTPLCGSEKLTRNLVLSLLPVTVFARTRGVALENRLRVLHYLYSRIAEKSITNPAAWPRELKQALS